MSSLAKRVSFISAPGGVGKTKLALLLTGYLAKQNKKVLFIDLDPTAGASLLLLDETIFENEIEKGHSLADLIDDYMDNKSIDIRDYIIEEPVYIYNYPFELLLPGEKLMDLMDRLWNSVEPGNIFKEILEKSGINTYYDYVVIDTIPFFIPKYTALSIYVSSTVFIPLRPSLVDLKRTLIMVKNRILKLNTERTYCIFNQVPTRVQSAEYILVNRKVLNRNLDLPKSTIEEYALLEKYYNKLASRVRFLPIFLKYLLAIERFPPFRRGFKKLELYSEQLIKDEKEIARKNVSEVLEEMIKVL